MTQEDIQTLVLSATPLYAIVIGIEMIMSYVHNRHYYTAKDTLTNVYLAV
jgi:cytochrome c-type biogenesis protein CcmH/NrfF